MEDIKQRVSYFEEDGKKYKKSEIVKTNTDGTEEILGTNTMTYSEDEDNIITFEEMHELDRDEILCDIALNIAKLNQLLGGETK